MAATVTGELLERDDEIVRLEGALAASSDGEGRLILVVGEGGIGKTALLAAARRRAEQEGLQVLSAQGAPLEREFPWGVARQLYEPAVHRMSGAERNELLDGAARHAAPVLGLGSDRTGEPAAMLDAGFAVQHGLYWLTANLAERKPLLIVVDDAHWSDVATLLFLNYLARRVEGVAAAVLIGLRPAEPGAPRELLNALRSLPDVTVLQPAALSPESTATLVAGRTRRAPGERFTRACHEATGGNPFLLEELLRALAGDEVEPSDDATSAVLRLGPASIAQSVVGRIATMWPEAAVLAQAAAVLDADAEVRHAATLAGLDEPRAQAAADALVDAHVLAPGRPLRFAHPILRHAVYSDLPEGRRRADHRRAARMLEAAHADPDRIAVHLLAAERTGDGWAVGILRQAARRAVARGAPAVATTLLQRALEEPPSPGARMRVLIELGQAARAIADPKAPDYLAEALEASADPAERAACARELAPALAVYGEEDRAISVLEQAVEDLPPERREERLLVEAEMLALGAFSDRVAGRAAARLDLLAPQLTGKTLAERLIAAGASHHRVFMTAGTGEETARLAELAIGDGSLLEHYTAASTHWFGPLIGFLWSERHEQAAALLDHAEDDARRNGLPAGQAFVAGGRARLALLQGDLRQAEAFAQSVATVAPEIGPVLAHYAAGTATYALVEQGRAAEALTYLAELGVADGPLSPTATGHTLLLARCAMRRELGDTAGALEDAEDSLRRQAVRGGVFTIPMATGSVALAFRAAGLRDRALEVANDQVAAAERFGVPGGEGAARLVLALVQGGPDALAQLERAVALLADSPRRLDHARALVELGSALRRANRRADARGPLTAGMDLAHHCGAVPLAERAREELKACGARPRRLVVTGVDSLTASERRVVQLAAEGRTNREIAEALFVTRKTVETHLGHAYRKLDVSSREELARLLAGEARDPAPA